MNNKLTLVTAPDDIFEDALRILLVGLDKNNTATVSTALTRLDIVPNTVVYVWNKGEDYQWLFDKKRKSSLIIFDCNTIDLELLGYLAAQPNSHYFGLLKDLEIINKNALYDVDQCFKLLGETVTAYERQFTKQ
jgi:hypothetical protein